MWRSPRAPPLRESRAPHTALRLGRPPTSAPLRPPPSPPCTRDQWAAACRGEATAALAIAEGHPLQRLPKSVKEALAAKALGLVFERLERRCQGGLRRAVERWIKA